MSAPTLKTCVVCNNNTLGRQQARDPSQKFEDDGSNVANEYLVPGSLHQRATRDQWGHLESQAMSKQSMTALSKQSMIALSLYLSESTCASDVRRCALRRDKWLQSYK